MPQLKDKNAGIFKIQIDVGEHFGGEESDFFIELREPTTEETMTLSNKEGEDKVDQEAIFRLMPHCIIDHNFFQDEEEKKKMSTAEVWKEIMRRPICATEVVERWSNNIPLAKRKVQSSEG